jgi:hypothetical protein
VRKTRLKPRGRRENVSRIWRNGKRLTYSVGARWPPTRLIRFREFGKWVRQIAKRQALATIAGSDVTMFPFSSATMK